MTTFSEVIGVVFAVVVACATAWSYRTYARTPRDQRMGLGRLAPAQQRAWNRFMACTVAVMAILGLLSALLESATAEPASPATARRETHYQRPDAAFMDRGLVVDRVELGVIRRSSVASKTVRIYTSDLTGKEIGNAEDLAEVRVLDHPKVSRPVKLDAYALELQSLLDADSEFVSLEVVLPGQAPRRLVVPVDTFDKLFQTDIDATLAGAERFLSSAAPARTGRTATKSKSSSSDAGSKEQRAAVREWANNNGYTVGDRGRIKTDIIEAFEAAHAGN